MKEKQIFLLALFKARKFSVLLRAVHALQI